MEANAAEDLKGFPAMRQRLIDRGLLDVEFRLTDAGNEHALGLIKTLSRRAPKTAPKDRPVKPMGHPDYKYAPHSAERNAKQSATVRQRLGIPEGHRRVYGVHVPEAVAETIRPLATEIAGKRGFDAARAFVIEAEANGWKYDASKVPAKNGNVWTDERRKKASEGAKAMHARLRAARIKEAAKERPVEQKAVKQPEVVVNIQLKPQAAMPRDDGIREIHGVVGFEDSKSKRLTVVEDDNWAGLLKDAAREIRALRQRLEAQWDRSPQGGDAKLAPSSDESPVVEGDAP